MTKISQDLHVENLIARHTHLWEAQREQIADEFKSGRFKMRKRSQAE